MGAIWAIILAAGESKRMGVPKMFLIFNGKPMIECVIDNISQSEVDRTLVVLGAERDRLADLLSKKDVSYCYNDNYKDGMLSSVKCGIRNLPEYIEAVLVFQGDQPLIKSDIISHVIEAYRASDKEIVIPVYNKKRGHPLLIGSRYRDKIESLDPNEGLRSLSYLYHNDVLEVQTDDPGILRDFDTFEDYRNEVNQIL